MGEQHRGGKLRLASPQECLEVFGYYPGSIPPVGLRVATRLVLDASLHHQPAEVRDVVVTCLCMQFFDSIDPVHAHTQAFSSSSSESPMLLACGAGEAGRVFVCPSDDLLALGGPDALVASVCCSAAGACAALLEMD